MVLDEVKSTSISIPTKKASQRSGKNLSSQHFFVLLALLAAVSAIRMLIIGNLPLTGDEAYYWQWSRHLALGYHDHPPLVGWLIRLSSFLGDSAFWVRFPSIVLSFFSTIFLYLFTKEIWQSEKKAFQTVALLVAIPIFSICALAIFPDAPLVFSWAFFLWGAWKWVMDENNWPWMGLPLGLAALSKLMGLFLLPSLILFLLITDKTRLTKASFWKSLALALIVASPFLWWNTGHGFETFIYQAHQRLSRGLSFSPSLFLNYASLQLIALSPLVLFLFVGTTKMLFQKALAGENKARFLLAMALPIHLFFAVVSFMTRVGLHWALPGYLSILAAAPVWLDESRKEGQGWGNTFYRFSLGSALLFTLFFFSLLIWPQHLVPWISSWGIHHRDINHGKALSTQSMAEILSYQDLGKRVNSNLEILKKSGSGNVFVLTDSYTLSSIISFYAKTETTTLLFTSTGGDYQRWNHFDDFIGGDALYVDTQPIGSRLDIDQVLHKAFRKVIPFSSLTVQRGSIETGTFYFARCIRLTHPEALRPNWPW